MFVGRLPLQRVVVEGQRVEIGLDAFGQMGIRPAGTPWAEVTLRRCNPTPYDVQGEFTPAAYYETFPQDTFDNVGVAPTLTGCAP